MSACIQGACEQPADLKWENWKKSACDLALCGVKGFNNTSNLREHLEPEVQSNLSIKSTSQQHQHDIPSWHKWLLAKPYCCDIALQSAVLALDVECPDLPSTNLPSEPLRRTCLSYQHQYQCWACKGVITAVRLTLTLADKLTTQRGCWHQSVTDSGRRTAAEKDTVTAEWLIVRQLQVCQFPGQCLYQTQTQASGHHPQQQTKSIKVIEGSIGEPRCGVETSHKGPAHHWGLEG